MKSGQTPQKFLYNGEELQDAFSTGYLDYGARMYSPELGRWIGVDKAADLMRWLTPYRYGFNNPLRFGDKGGMTEEERKKAVEKARSLIGSAYQSALPEDKRVTDGQLDCSGLVRLAMMQNENISDPFEGREGNGVTRIMGAARQVELNDVRDGDLVVIKSGDNQNGHVGFIKDIVRDEKGNVLSYTMLHSEAKWTNAQTGQTGGGNVNEVKIVVGSEKHYARSKYNHRFYQWDTPDTKKESPADEQLQNNYLTWQQVVNMIARWMNINPSIRLNVK